MCSNSELAFLTPRNVLSKEPYMYDAIVVGARCAGSPLAMLLARQKLRVLLVDRATYPSDTISTHFIWPPGVACLKRWGLLDRLRAAGCPAVYEVGFDPGPFRYKGRPPGVDGIQEMYGPRRTLLDKLLLDAAAEAGAEAREGFTVTEILSGDGRVTGIRGHRRNESDVVETARIVVGADGRHSLVAKSVDAEVYNARPTATCVYYSYWRGVPPHDVIIRVRGDRVLITTAANDGLTIALVSAPIADFETAKSDVEAHFWASVDRAPELAALLRQGERVERFYGTGDMENFFRKPYGEGWALVGDAGYHKDPATAQGISDAFRSAEWLAQAIETGLSGTRPMTEAMADYQRTRDEHFLPMYELTYGMAQIQAPPPVSVQELQAALQNNQPEIDRFFGTLAGTVAIPEFYSPENVGRIMARAAAANA
jgi:flavin-dependent dehydrogenase